MKKILLSARTLENKMQFLLLHLFHNHIQNKKKKNNNNIHL